MSYEFIDTAASALAAIPTNALSNTHLFGAAASTGNPAGGDIVSIPDPAGAQAASVIAEEDPDTILFIEPEHGSGEGDDDRDAIVVIGKRLKVDAPGSGGGGSGDSVAGTVYLRNDYIYNLTEQPLDPENPDLTVINPPADEVTIEITVNVDPLTADQEAVVKKFKSAVEDARKAVFALQDDAWVTLTDGKKVTGAELKAIWATIDFTINPANTVYDNTTKRGEASYVNGDAKVSLNIDLVVEYSNNVGGLEYLALHEMSHMTKSASEYYAKLWEGGLTDEEAEGRERYADDIARAIAVAHGLTFLSNPTYGFNTADPLGFSYPDTGGGDPGSGGGGGGGGWVVPEPL